MCHVGTVAAALIELFDREEDTLATQLTVEKLIDEDIRHLQKEWESLDVVISEWPQMDGIDREVFILEWSGINGGKLLKLQTLIGQMTPTQKQRYQDL